MKESERKKKKANKRTVVLTIIPFFLLLFTINQHNDKLTDAEYSKVLQKGAIDTEICAMNKMCKDLIETKGAYAKADTIAQVALAMAKKADYKKGLADTYNCLGENEWYQHNHPGAIENYNKAEKIEQAIGYTDGLLRTLAGLSDVYESQGDFDIALFEEKEVQNLQKVKIR